MSTWILLLRGINVGGRNSLPMKELRRHLSSLDLEEVSTYIQSGNAVFSTSDDGAVEDLPERLASLIEKNHGFRPHVLVLSQDAWERAMAANPFPEAEAEPKTLHLFFLMSAPESPELSVLTDVQAPSERFRLTDEVFYLHSPDGIGRSKLVTKIGKSLGVEMTARNWRTVEKLREMASG